MMQTIQGIAVSRGIAIGRAVPLGREPIRVRHYLVAPAQVEQEVARLQQGFALAVQQLRQVQQMLTGDDASSELAALLDVHLMLLDDASLLTAASENVRQRRYNAEWALVLQLEQLSREFDAMDDGYLRERKSDIEQLVERVLRCMRGEAAAMGDVLSQPQPDATGAAEVQGPGGELQNLPLIIVARDLAPTDMLQFRQKVFAGFVVDTGGSASHTAIVARSMDIPAVVGAKQASARIRRDDCLIVHADAGLVIVNPDAPTLAHYTRLQQALEVRRQRQQLLLHTPAVTRDGETIELLANVELPSDCPAALAAGAQGIGLFRSEFLFMDRHGQLPDEEEQFQAYRQAVEAMQGRTVTIRTVDIGADKPLSRTEQRHGDEQSALGLRAIRWSLAEPQMFRAQLRGILRAAAHGPVNVLFPMLAQLSEIRQALEQLEMARAELRATGLAFGDLQVGAMIEVPAAALMIDQFLRHFDFVSIGTNDLTQYTLAVDRADESVAHLFDGTHPAVLQLIALVIRQGLAHGKKVCLCGEMAGDTRLTRLLLGLGLRSFSMHPAQLLAVKEQILQSDAKALRNWAEGVLRSEEPLQLIEGEGAELI
ncbi:phosphoenolpyruvate--protein phosphotransferase [Corticibacter populi]|uniref:Phosphoenolpyruvate-protein phosphotransferase n=1 Tax=Corticibacter populi TaxID=1550736 RepID=A0A3M6QZH3_9BURK|nr:phosphoenolpyruvate--protein phosphotransferase [Corticibacter populi]RMX08313.1 phosphoenolpyruvate--protein phosphotransferase [Corticibacter populi]RZS35598.1 phosphoenolpyruvate--protein phosphotransferase [Corticibacter populi]